MQEFEIADWQVYPRRETVAAAIVEGVVVSVLWSDGRRSPFHFPWLRDNCPCSACVHPMTREQTFEITDVPEGLAPRIVAPDAAGGLSVEWDDGHASRFHPGWLRAHAYDDASRAERRRAAAPWGAERATAVPSFRFAAIMADAEALRAWLVALRDVGLTLVTDVPVETGSVGQVARRVSPIRETNFGVLFDVAAKPDPDSNAYTAVALPLHTDLPTRELQPGVQLLHCLANEATGGDSLFVDGFAVAAALKEEHPEDFATLVATPIEFRNKDRRSDYRCRAPMIALDADGAITEVRVANFLRGPFDAPPQAMPRLYRAYRRFVELTRQKRLLVQARLRPGDMWAFDNRRVLHARTEFDAASGRRHLQGCYLDRDELLSRIRILDRDLAARA